MHGEPGSYAERFVKMNHNLLTFVTTPIEETVETPTQAEIRMTPPIPQRTRMQQVSSDPDFLFRALQLQEPAETVAQPVAQPVDTDEPAFFHDAVETPTPQSKPVAKPPAPQPPPPVEQRKQSKAKEVVPKTTPVTVATTDIPAGTPVFNAYNTTDPTPAVIPTTPFEDDELNYTERIKRELEEARKRSVPVDPTVKLPQLTEEPIAPTPKPTKQKKSKAKSAAQPAAKKRKKPSILDDLHDESDELEWLLREKETPEETKARHRASLLDDLPDLPDLPEEREYKNRAADSTATASPTEPPTPAPAASSNPPADEDDAAPPNDDPFADIHWNDDQSTFTIRL